MEAQRYQLILSFHILESDVRLLSARIESHRQLDIPLNEVEIQSAIVHLLTRCMTLIESFIQSPEKVHPPYTLEYLVAPSIGAMIFGTSAGLLSPSVGLVMCSSAVGSLFASLFIDHHLNKQPKQKTLSENLISRIIVLHQELTTLSSQLYLGEK